MQTVPSATTRGKPIPPPHLARIAADLIGRIRDCLDQDGSHVLPGSVDSQGMTVAVGIYGYHIEISEPEALDWDQHSPLDWTDTYLEPEF